MDQFGNFATQDRYRLGYDSRVYSTQITQSALHPPQFPAPYTHFQASQQQADVSTGPKPIPPFTALPPGPLPKPLPVDPNNELYEGGATSTTTVKDMEKIDEKNRRSPSPRKSPEKGKEKSTGKVPSKVPSHGGRQRGRQQGATNFGEDATVELLKIVEKYLPIGGSGWDAVKKEYNMYAEKDGLPERDSRSLRQKFDKLVNTAMVKPTGEANRSHLLETALRIYNKLDEKSGTALLLDEDMSEKEHEAQDEAGPGVANTREAIHLASDEEPNVEDGLKASKKGKATRKTRVSTSQAADTLAEIGSYFSTNRVREREEARANTSSNFFQLYSALTELREVRLRNEQLLGTLNLETRRADKLENQTSNLKEKIEDLRVQVRELKDDLRYMKRTRHRRHQDSDSESDSPREHRRRRKQSIDSTPIPQTNPLADVHEGLSP